MGMLFFGVPNRGMNIESLRAMYTPIAGYNDLKCQVNDSWKMAGPKRVLVDRFSATYPRLWESDDEGFNRTHSELVKFSWHDVDYERVLYKLREIASRGTATLNSRYLSQGSGVSLLPTVPVPNESNLADDWMVIESPSVMNSDEEACLRSLAFAEIHARESIIEPAVQNTGSWLLERQNFRDWIKGMRVDEHRGFFWIQGNPGSGKSTLMKKVYLHVKACHQDPSSVIAAFFFNARGNDIEKSPTGLIRTLLHTLCQRISALRNRVVKAYVAKRRLLNSDWQWQLSELKDFLAAAVTSSVIGQRDLRLFVDALDECDFAATQTMIHMFEDLASTSFSQGTRFSICLSSRYWPQFKIRYCFTARVELENEGDIATYIQKRLEPTQINDDPRLHAALQSELLEKAKGTFLWVVLIVRDLLHASNAGATLRELHDIVQNVPADLREFYQHQLQCTKGEDREHMLRLLQVVFYAQRPLSSTELRDALTFGCGTYTSYAEWSQSSEYVGSDERMERRIREHSKGLVEIIPWPEDDESAQGSAQSTKARVQFIHQSVRDFLTAAGFSFLRDSRWRTHDADGHEFIKLACLNYLRTKDFEPMLFGRRSQVSNLRNDHPLLEYVVQYIFPHAAQAESNGVRQDELRDHICSNRQGLFERWRCIHDMFVSHINEQGPEARPIHILAQYGLLTWEIAERQRNIDIEGGPYSSALAAACWGGHEDAVQILLALGADPTSHAPIHTLVKPHRNIAPLRWAIENHDLPVLRRLLNHSRSYFTLLKRLNFVLLIKDKKPYTEAVLALLVPEASLPHSSIDGLSGVAQKGALGVFLLLLNKFEESIVYDESLWASALGGGNPNGNADRISRTRALLDRGGRVKITEDFVKRLHIQHGNSGGGLSLLPEYCEAEVTEGLIDSICLLADSMQTVCALEAAGHRVDPFTPKQLCLALKHRSVEGAAFFLQHEDGNASADEKMTSALSNPLHGEEVTRLVLGYTNPDHINEGWTVTALENNVCGSCLISLLNTRWGGLKFSEAALAAAVRHQWPKLVKFVLENCECVRVTEKVLTAAAGSKIGNVDLLLLHSPDIIVQESTIVAAVGNHDSGPDILDAFCKRGKSLSCTEAVVAAAAKIRFGEKVLEIVLKQDRGRKTSSSMIMAAMQSAYSAALLSVMLHHDPNIVIQEEHLIAAASNIYYSHKVFAFLQTKGKLGNLDLDCEVLNTGPAKRRKVSRKPSLHISPEVINASFSKPDLARMKLLELFWKWGVITETEFDGGFSDNYRL